MRAKRRGVAERFEIKKDHPAAPVVLPKLQQVVARDVRLVADADKIRKTETPAAGERQNGDAERAALGGQRHDAGRRKEGRERRVERHFRIRVEQAQAIRSHHAHAVAAHFFDELLLELAPAAAGLGKAGRDHDERLDAALRAVVDDAERGVARHDDDRKIDRRADLADRSIGRERADLGGARVDGIDRAAKAIGREVFDDPMADAGIVP